MKLKLVVLLATVAVAMGLLLGASTTQAEPIVIVEGDTATDILSLEVGGTFYDVAFLRTSADNLYGTEPVFDFPDEASAKEAKVAAVLALNTDNRATRAGPSAAESAPDFGIGFREEEDPFGGRAILVQNASYIGKEIQAWVDADVDIWPPAEEARIYADFTPADPPPDPVTIGGTVTGLEGSGFVLQNNRTDDLPIAADGSFTFGQELTPGNSYFVTVATNPTNPTQTCVVENGSGTVPNEPVTDVVVTCVETPPPVTIGGTVTGLVGTGLLLQNTGRDDLPIAADGPFTFAEPRTPGTFYDVTVATNPTNPSQTCSVTNGSGTVPLTPVTDVAVTCVEVTPGNVSKVVAEGDTLPDDTTVDKILLEGGVSINSLGEVAFHGQSGRTSAVFTQEGLVVKEGDTLPDDSDVDRIFDTGGVAINLLGEVAFHGRESRRFETVFTQDGLVAKEGDRLEDLSIPEEISERGRVAINLFGQVAFHGHIEIEGGLFDEILRAVFTQDGVVAQEAVALPDNSKIEEISDNAGLAINDFGLVAFHGEVINPQEGPDTLSAVFTQNELIVKEGDTLPDNSIVSVIRKESGVAINLLGQVAFQGRVFEPAPGIDTVYAVFTQDGLVVKEGDTLPDGTIVEEISETGGVAINDFGQVAFHGRTGGVEAVFTQEGLVAKEGDNLTDGTTTLEEISDTGGVAINNFGEVVFHGKINNIDAIFMSGTEPPSISFGEADLFKAITW